MVPDLVGGFDFGGMKILSPEYILDDWHSRESDLLVELPFRVGDQEVSALVCLLLEHQSQTDPRMPLRLLVYAANYWDRKWREWEERARPKPAFRLNPLLPIVFYTGPGRWGSNRSLADLLGEPAVLHPFSPRFEPIFWELGTHSPESLRDSQAILGQFLAVLRLADEAAAVLEPIYRSPVENLDRLTGGSGVRWSDMIRLLLTLTAWRRPEEERKDWWDMTEAMVEEQARLTRLREMQKKIAESFRREGREEGATLNARETLLRLGTRKFRPPSAEIVETVNRIEERSRLEEMTDRVLTATSWEEIVQG